MIFCEQVSTSVPAVIVCDRCGRRLEKEAHGFEFQEALCLRFVGGYASVWGDGSTIEVDLCQQCAVTRCSNHSPEPMESHTMERRVAKIVCSYDAEGHMEADFFWSDTGEEPFVSREYLEFTRLIMETIENSIDILNQHFKSHERQ